MTKRQRSPAPPSHPRTRGDWRKWLDFGIAFAESALAKQGSVAPMISILDPRGEFTNLLSAGSREDSYTLWRIACIAHEAIGYVFMTEGWMRPLGQIPGESEAESRERAFAVPPSQAQDRIEVIMASVVWRDEANEIKTLGTVREIVRDAQGKVVRTKRTAMPDTTDHHEGAVTEILLPEPPPMHHVLAAKDLLASIIKPR